MAKPSWITLSKLSGTGNDTVIITAEKNVSTIPRSGVVIVKTASGLIDAIQVEQEGKVANSIQGAGIFCSVGIASSLLLNTVTDITMCVQLRLSNGTKVEAGRTTLSKGGSSYLTGFLYLDSEKVSIEGEANIVAISVSCIPGTAASTAGNFSHFIGNVIQAPGPLNFGIEGSSATYSVRFVQSTGDIWSFELDQTIPITGDTTLVYKGEADNLPFVEITRLGY